MTTNEGDIISDGELPLPAESWRDPQSWIQKDGGNYSVDNFVGLNKSKYFSRIN